MGSSADLKQRRWGDGEHRRDVEKRHWAQNLRARVFVARNPKSMSVKQLDEHAALSARYSRVSEENVQLEKDKSAVAGDLAYCKGMAEDAQENMNGHTGSGAKMTAPGRIVSDPGPSPR